MLCNFSAQPVLKEICNSINSTSLLKHKQTKTTNIHHFKFIVKGLKLLLDLFIPGNLNDGNLTMNNVVNCLKGFLIKLFHLFHGKYEVNKKKFETYTVSTLMCLTVE